MLNRVHADLEIDVRTASRTQTMIGTICLETASVAGIWTMRVDEKMQERVSGDGYHMITVIGFPLTDRSEVRLKPRAPARKSAAAARE